MNLDVLAVGAHPDDVEMTSGGLLLKMKDRGRSTGILHLTRGEMGSRGTPEERAEEARTAAALLAADWLRILEFPDSRIWEGEELVAPLVELLRETRPGLVLTHFPRDPHPDHGRAGRLVAAAVHCAGLRNYPSRGEPHHVRQVLFAMYRGIFRPHLVVDVTDQLERKRAAVLAYASQVGPTQPGEEESRLSSPMFLRHWEARQAHFGSLIGRPFGEAYFCEYVFCLEDPLEAFPVPQQRRMAVEPVV